MASPNISDNQVASKKVRKIDLIIDALHLRRHKKDKSINPQASSPFFARLPSEIRNMIYIMMFTPDTGRQAKAARIILQPLLVCRRLYSEASSLAWTRVSSTSSPFTVWPERYHTPLSTRVQRLNPTTASHLQRILIPIYLSPSSRSSKQWAWNGQAFALAQILPVRVLELQITYLNFPSHTGTPQIIINYNFVELFHQIFIHALPVRAATSYIVHDALLKPIRRPRQYLLNLTDDDSLTKNRARFAQIFPAIQARRVVFSDPAGAPNHEPSFFVWAMWRILAQVSPLDVQGLWEWWTTNVVPGSGMPVVKRVGFVERKVLLAGEKWRVRRELKGPGSWVGFERRQGREGLVWDSWA